MGEYKISETTKSGCLILIIFLTLSIMGLISLHYAPAFIVILMFIVFDLYLLSVSISILGDTFNAIIIDSDNDKFFLKKNNNMVADIPFTDISNIYVYKGQVVSAIHLGHIKILTKSNKIYRVTIEKADTFCLHVKKNFLPNQIIIEKKDIYRASWNTK